MPNPPQADASIEPNRLVLLTGCSGYVGGRLLPMLESLPLKLRCLARKPDGTWVGWGNNFDNELGIVGTSPVPTPTQAAFGLELTDMAIDGSGACGIDAAGVAHCWGAGPLALPLVTVLTMPPPN